MPSGAGRSAGSSHSAGGSAARARFEPVDPVTLADRLAADLIDLCVPGTALRLAIDGPRAADPGAFAEALVVALRALGRPSVHIRTETFWRDAALRLEYGRSDLESYVEGWLDTDALRREVLDPFGLDGTGCYLPSLRDPITNRATREPLRSAPPGLVALISGELLLGRGLPFDATIHLALSPGARRRRTPPEWQWTLPAFEAYDAAVDPVRTAGVALRYDDPEHPALRVGPAIGVDPGGD